MDNVAVWLSALLKPFLGLAFVWFLFYFGDRIVPRIERHWPTWLGRRLLFKRWGDRPQ